MNFSNNVRVQESPSTFVLLPFATSTSATSQQLNNLLSDEAFHHSVLTSLINHASIETTMQNVNEGQASFTTSTSSEDTSQAISVDNRSNNLPTYSNNAAAAPVHRPVTTNTVLLSPKIQLTTPKSRLSYQSIPHSFDVSYHLVLPNSFPTRADSIFLQILGQSERWIRATVLWTGF